MTLEQLHPIAETAGLAHNVGTTVLLAIWWVESRWNETAVNAQTLATGLGQVIPSEYGTMFASRPTSEELKDPVVNADWSARILRGNLTRRGEDLRAAVKDYSGGWGVSGDDAFDRIYWQPFLAKYRELEQLIFEGGVEMGTVYPRPPEDTGAGVHLSAGFAHPMGENEGNFAPLASRLRGMGLTWAKLGDMGGTAIKPCQVLLDHGIMPVVRMYRQHPYPGRLDQKQRETVATLARMGVRYFERGNEPNLVDEHSSWPTDWNAWFSAWARDWYDDALFISSYGGLTAVDALAPGGNWAANRLVWGNGDDIGFLKRMLEALREVPGAYDLLRRTGWVSVHPATLNHPPEFPDDPVNQAEHPGWTVHTHYYPDGTATGASNGWRKWEAVREIVRGFLGSDIALIGTEGGAWPGSLQDGRYPELTNETASQMNYQTLGSMRTSPGWQLAHMPWLLINREAGNLAPHFERDAWIRVPGYGSCPPGDPRELPILQMLEQSPLQARSADWGGGEPSPGDLQQTIGDAVQAGIIPLNPATAFEISAKAKGLLPASPETDVQFGGAVYRAQAYRKETDRATQHIVYAKVGDWGNLTWFTRAN